MSALWPTIRRWGAGAYAAYSVVAAGVPWRLHALLLATIAVAVVVAAWLATRLREQRLVDDLFPVRASHDVVRRERAMASERGTQLWWEPFASETRWLDTLWLFWHKTSPIRAGDVSYRQTVGPLTPGLFGGSGDAPDGPHVKAALVRPRGFLSDQAATLEVAPLSWEFARWVESNSDAFDHAHAATVSRYGVPDLHPHPSILCTHNIVETGDGWVLLSLRSPRTDYFPLTWSATFEEQVEIAPRGGSTGRSADLTVEHTVLRGLREEFGPSLSSAVSELNVLGVGRQEDRSSGRVVRGGVIITRVVLDLALDEVWCSLEETARIRDLTEHFGWMAARPGDRADVQSLLERRPADATVGVGPSALAEDPRLSVPVSVHPMSAAVALRPEGYGWHPTSRARLWLWAYQAFERPVMAGA